MMIGAKEFFLQIIEKFEEFKYIYEPPDTYFLLIPFNKIMKISQIKDAVLNGRYDRDYWSFICDVNLSLKIVKSKLPKQFQQRIKNVTLLQEFVDNKMEGFMVDNGYCCGRWYVSRAKSVVCSGARDDDECSVKDGQGFYRYDKFTFCEQHLMEKFGNEQILKLNDHVIIDRRHLIRYIFHQEIDEKFVRCKNCKKDFHERCVLHLSSPDYEFLCTKCRPHYDIRFKKLSSRTIPQTPCDKYITKFLKIFFRDFQSDSNITIRMLSSEQAKFNISKVLHWRNYDMPLEIYYQNVTLFAFLEDPEFGEICFFTMYVQLYGDFAPEPNKRSAYISFIDSAKYYKGERRTELYQMMILGFFSFIKRFGYKKVFIWSCPPNEGVDYVLPFKPIAQKTPNSEILDKWYENLIKKGKEITVKGEAVIIDSPLVEDYAHAEEWEKMDNIPLFDDDIWVTKLGEMITDIEKQAHQERLKYRTSNTMPYFNKDKALWEAIQVELKAKNKNYFVVILQGDKPKGATDIPDNFITLERNWVNNRHLLIDFFCDSKLMFYDMRQASFATYFFLYRLILENSLCRVCFKPTELNVSDKKLRPYLLCSSCEDVGIEAINVKKRITSKDYFK